MIYVLTLRDIPVAAAYRFERLNERLTEYSREDQAHMRIHPTDILT